MMALAMVVITSMIGVRGWVMRCCRASTAYQVGRGLLAGLGIVILAIVFDRITQALRRYQHQTRILMAKIEVTTYTRYSAPAAALARSPQRHEPGDCWHAVATRWACATFRCRSRKAAFT